MSSPTHEDGRLSFVDEEPRPGDAPDEPLAHEENHIAAVIREVLGQSREKQDLLQYCRRGSRSELGDKELAEHIRAVFAAGGVVDIARRNAEVEAGCQRHQSHLMERKSRKKERMREAGRLAVARRDPAPCTERANPPSPPQPAQQEESVQWAEVKSFTTQEEALQFVVECQPFDCLPLMPPGQTFPSYDSPEEAYQIVLNMHPRPTEFVSAVNDFKRRLRIVKVDPEQIRQNRAACTLLHKAHSVLSKRRTLPSMSARQPEEVAATAPNPLAHERWIVQAAGPLFERPPKLRDLSKEVGNAKYFVAVAPGTERSILSEGYTVMRRTSIPCAATPGDAVAAYLRGEEREGLKEQPVVLVVTVPSHVDVVAHRKGGFLIKARELPPSCFSRKRFTFVRP